MTESSNGQASSQQPSSVPIALMLFIVITLMAAPLYTSEDAYLFLAAQALRGVSLSVVLIPLFLLLAVQIMSLPKKRPAPPSKTVPFSEVGGSSVGIAFMVLFILLLIWWQPAL